jgi:hypothetical protein
MATIEEAAAGAEDPNAVTTGLRALAKILSLRENFLIDLFQDPDDWSFIVKAHALLESVLPSIIPLTYSVETPVGSAALGHGTSLEVATGRRLPQRAVSRTA